MTYFVGCAREKVPVDHAIGMNLQGYAIKSQTIQQTGDLFARAFVIADDKRASAQHRTAIVVVDIWSCTEELKLRVFDQLHLIDPGILQYYTPANLQICGTHTHSAPAGISTYPLYNFSSGGFSAAMTDAYARAIAKAIVAAHKSAEDCHVHVYRTTVPNCGANRSQPAYDNNPAAERARYATSVDEDMTILCFRAVNHFRLLGTLAWHALHGTDIGQGNRTIDGDNKGRASALLEAGGVPVAAFANANAGDVSGNVAFGTLPPPDPSRADAHARLLVKAVTDQVHDPARGNDTLVGGTWCALRLVDMANVTIAGTGRRTYRAAMGLSSFAGSTEDSVAPPPANQLREGIREGEASPVEAAIQALIAAGGSENNINDELVRFLFPDGHDRLLDTLPPLFGPVLAGIAHLGLDALQWFAGGLGARSVLDLTPDERQGHAPKPITMNVSNITPHVLPLQIIRIGQLAILGVPGEPTTMAGRRMREQVLAAFKQAPPPPGIFAPVETVITAGYANAYSQYITTRQEYEMQHYEGASTLFGPHTLEAYIQEFGKMILQPASA